ncbi:UNVERIFIED_CONTAM: NADH-ubiquinone oxidoreductase chain 5 [Sesamum calycinum]|uniref:NADH-ubiquinone oxidoreductase chain 5 n=1 Tax=Sesamum calycinum TaxID=2727403 RepID=A0AAW2J3L1_9LAMI
MNCRVNRSDPDAAVAPRRYGLDPLLPALGHHSMSGIRGDILDVSTPLVGGCAALPFDRYTVEEADHERYRCGSDPARGRLCPDGGALWGRAQPNRDSTPPTSSAPLYRLNHSKGLVGGTGEPRELACTPYLRLLRQAVDSFMLEGEKGPKHGRCRLFGHTVPAEDQVGEPCEGKPSRTADKAAIKAMLVNRVGDFGLAPGISGSHTWSPDAMEGPTPVSALIHAATMVTAGVFMIARCSPLFEYPPTALIVITFAGAMTSFLAATTGILQNDLKRVIAYSTCSQLGYMIFACGISNYSVSVFHLMNHAFFKALLFLSAGSVIHAMSDEQDMRWGGLPPRSLLPMP